MIADRVDGGAADLDDQHRDREQHEERRQEGEHVDVDARVLRGLARDPIADRPAQVGRHDEGDQPRTEDDELPYGAAQHTEQETGGKHHNQPDVNFHFAPARRPLEPALR